MTTECYYGNCKYHGNHDGEEGPFCFESDCRASEYELMLHSKIRSQELAGYDAQKHVQVLIDALEYLIAEARLTDSQYEVARQALALPQALSAFSGALKQARYDGAKEAYQIATQLCNRFAARDMSPAECASAISRIIPD